MTYQTVNGAGIQNIVLLRLGIGALRVSMIACLVVNAKAGLRKQPINYCPLCD